MEKLKLMKKFYLALGALLLASGMAHAVPAKPGFTTFKQSDGSTISVEMRGDEFHHSFVTHDGIPLMRAANGDFYYRTTTGMTSVLAHEKAERGASELEFIKSQGDKMSLQHIFSASKRASMPMSRKRVGHTQVPTTGSPRVPIILVEYTDKKMSNSKADFVKHYTSGNKSVTQYFKDQSNGLYNPQFDVYGIYTLDNTRDTYGGNDARGNDVGVARMVGDAIDKAGDNIDWTKYDNDGDGEADVCIVVYAGVGEAQASQTVPQAVWPCQWTLFEGAYFNDGEGPRTRNNIRIDRFAVFNEVTGSYDGGKNLDGIGTFCHEFSHCLGLPDFYETTYSHGYYGMGEWSLMDGGCYNNNGYTPIGYSAYEKNFVGWLDLVEPKPNTQYALPVLNQSKDKTETALKVVSDINPNEYYLLEYRRRQGWDRFIQDEGVLISHVSYVPSCWEENKVNNSRVQLMTVAAADNSLRRGSESGDLFGRRQHDFTDDTAPCAQLYLTASGDPTGHAGKLGKPITNIILDGDTARLWFMKGVVSLDAPQVKAPTQVTETSFTANWAPVQGATSYTLNLRNEKAKIPAKLLLDEDMREGTTWIKKGEIRINYGYLTLGVADAIGSITSPGFDLGDYEGKTTVVVDAKGGFDGVKMMVSINDGADKQEVELSSTATEHVVVLNGNADEGNTVTISSLEPGKKVHLRGVKIYGGDYDGKANAPQESGDALMRTITGITGNSYEIKNLTAGGRYVYRVKAVYNETSASKWSDLQKITLVAQAGAVLGDVDGNGTVDVSDVTTLTNYILGLNPSPFLLDNADVNRDGKLNVTDVTGICNIILTAKKNQ